MLCRVVLTAFAISYLLCVLLLSGLQKEDIDVNTLKKLERYNVNIQDLNNGSLRQECLATTNILESQPKEPEIRNMNKSTVINITAVKVITPNLNIYQPRKDITHKPELHHINSSENKTTKTSDVTILYNVPVQLTDVYLNKLISRTNYASKEINNLNTNSNVQALDNTWIFRKNITNNVFPIKVDAALKTSRNESLIYSMNNSMLSEQNNYVNEVKEEIELTQNLPKPIQNPKSNNMFQPILQNNFANNAKGMQPKFDQNTSYLNVIKVPGQPNVIPVSNFLINTEMKPNIMNDAHKYSHFPYKIPLISKSGKNISKGEYLDQQNKQFIGAADVYHGTPITENLKTSIIKSENLEDWYSNFFRNNMVPTTPAFANAFKNKLQEKESFYPMYTHFNKDTLIRSHPLANSELNLNNHIRESWIDNLDELIEEPTTTENIFNSNKNIYEMSFSPMKIDEGEDNSMQSSSISKFMETKLWKDPKRRTQSLKTMLMNNRKSFNNIFEQINIKNNIESVQTETIGSRELTLLKKGVVPQKVETPITNPNTFIKFSLRVNEETSKYDDTNIKPNVSFLQNNKSENKKNSDNLSTNLTTISDKEKIKLVTNSLVYINDILKINQENKSNDTLIQKSEHNNVNVSYSKKNTVNGSTKSSYNGNQNNSKPILEKPPLPEDIIQKIVKSVKDIVLKDIRKEITTLQPSNTPITSQPRTKITSKSVLSTIISTLSSKVMHANDLTNPTIPTPPSNSTILVPLSTTTTMAEMHTVPSTTATTYITTTNLLPLNAKSSSSCEYLKEKHFPRYYSSEAFKHKNLIVTDKPQTMYEQNKSQDSDYILHKLMDLITGLRSSPEQNNLTMNLTSNLVRSTYELFRKQYNEPTYNPIIVNHRVEIITPSHIHLENQHVGKDTHESAKIPTYLPNIHVDVFSSNNIHKVPITLQTNLNEIEPLGVPVQKPISVFNQIIVITTARTPMKENKKGIEHKKTVKRIEVNDDKFMKEKVLTGKVEDNNGQRLGISEEINYKFIQQSSGVPDSLANFRVYNDNQPPLNSNLREKGHGYIDPNSQLKVVESGKPGVLQEPIFTNQTTRYKVKSHFYRLNRDNPNRGQPIERKIGFRSRQGRSRFRQRGPPHSIIKFHERLERVDDLPQPKQIEDIDKIKFARHDGEVPPRQQMPMNSLKKRKKFDDSHFKNFLKTQQKVNEMLERLLGRKDTPGSSISVEILR